MVCSIFYKDWESSDKPLIEHPHVRYPYTFTLVLTLAELCSSPGRDGRNVDSGHGRTLEIHQEHAYCHLLIRQNEDGSYARHNCYNFYQDFHHRPKSVRNRCLIELFVALFVFSLFPFDISVGVGAFVIGLSQISSFLSWKIWVKHLLGIFNLSS